MIIKCSIKKIHMNILNMNPQRIYNSISLINKNHKYKNNRKNKIKNKFQQDNHKMKMKIEIQLELNLIYKRKFKKRVIKHLILKNLKH